MSVDNYITLNQLKKTTEALLIKINEDGDTKVSKTSVQAALSQGVKIAAIGDIDLYAPDSMNQEQVQQAIQEYLTYNYSSLIEATLTNSNGSYRLDYTYNQLLSLLFGQHVFVIVKTFDVNGYYDSGEFVVSSSGSGPILYPNYHVDDGILLFSCVSEGTYYCLQVTSSGGISYSQNPVNEKADWEQINPSDGSYILNKPAIKAGDGEDSVVTNKIKSDQNSAIYTLLITGTKGSTQYSYTTQDSLPTTAALKEYTTMVKYTSNGYDYYHKLRDITNNTITLTDSCSKTEDITNGILLLYYKKENLSLGKYSFTIGQSNAATGVYSFAQGNYTLSAGGGSHAQGIHTLTKGPFSHAEGWKTITRNKASHAEGQQTQASGEASHAQGYGTIATRLSQHVLGAYNIQDPLPSSAWSERGTYIEIVGNGNRDNRSNARTLDWSGNEVLAGKLTVGSGPANDMDVATKQYVDTIAASAGGQSDWQQNDDTAGDYIKNKPPIKAGQGQSSIIQGLIEDTSSAATYTLLISGDAKATTYTYTTEDTLPTAANLKNYGLAYYENGTNLTTKYHKIIALDKTNQTITFSYSCSSTAAIVNGTLLIYTHIANKAEAMYSHAEGEQTFAMGNDSHAQGAATFTGGLGSHAEGYRTESFGMGSHSQGTETIATDRYSHAEGKNTQALSVGAHAEGLATIVTGYYSHAQGSNTIANHASQNVFGEYNIEDPSSNLSSIRGNYVQIVGNGTSTNRSNARTLDWSGNEILSGKLTVGADPTAAMDVVTKQYFETNVSTLIQAALAEYGDGDTASYGYPSVNGVEF